MKSPDQTNLTPDNIVAFLRNIFIRHVQFPIWDETAKVPGKKTRPFAYYVPLLEGLIDAKSSRGIAMSTPT